MKHGGSNCDCTGQKCQLRRYHMRSGTPLWCSDVEMWSFGARPALWRVRRAGEKGRPGIYPLATQHGAKELTILMMIPTLLHHGMIVVGLPYAFQGLVLNRRDHRRLALWRLNCYESQTVAACRRITN